MTDHRQSGLSLVELLVAVVIGLLGILAMTQVYLMSEQFNRSTAGEGSAQTGGLIALYTMERDIRMSGYGIADSTALGCGIVDWYYEPKYSKTIDASSTLPNITLSPVAITTNGSNPDSISIMFTTSSERTMPGRIMGFNAADSEVTVDGTAGFRNNDLVLLVNLTGTPRCTMTKVTQVLPATQVLQMLSVPTAPNNPPSWGSFPGTYANGDLILNLGNPVIRTYSINNNKLRVTDSLLQAAGSAASDLVDGVVDLRAQYGMDNGVGGVANDGIVDQYTNSSPTTSEQWQQLLSVRLGLLARIGVYEKPATGANCDATTTARTWSGGTFSRLDLATLTSEDRCYRYRVFETVIPLRNMIWRAS
ncbi:MAG: PilW family protein [Betaproteobacteria bacterium]|jgi:type IV pilus assembly protein PilW|nr:PilW family protein [Betaproteobacteria bacterium]